MQHKRKSEHSVPAGVDMSVPANGEVTLATDRRPGRDNLLTRVVLIGSAGSILIALLGLLSYVPGLALLGSVREGYIPMAPSTAISFIVLAIILLTISLRSLPDWTFRVIGALTMLVTLFAALEVVGHFTGIDLNFEHALVPAAGYLGKIPIAHMSPSTGALFFLAGLAALALLLRLRMQGRETLLGHWGGGLGSLVFAVSLVFCLAYLYGSPLLYGQGTTVPMALTTALAFMLLGSATVGASGENAIPVSLLVAFKRSGKPMSARRRFVLLALIMIGASGMGMAIITTMLFRTSLNEHEEKLLALVQSQAKLMESVALYDAEMAEAILEGYPDHDASRALISQISEARKQFEGFGERIEFIMARHDGDSITFIMGQLTSNVDYPSSMAFDSDLAQPMRLALEGQSGTLIARNYQGTMILAAYEPVAVLNLGFVAEIELNHIREPFIKSGIMAVTIAQLFILAGTALFFWIGNPIITRLETYSRDLEKEIEERKRTEEKLKRSEQKHKRLSNEMELIFDRLPGLIFYKNLKNEFVRVNKYVADSYQMEKNELAGMSLFDLHTKDQAQIYWDDDLEVIKSRKSKLDIVEPWDTVGGLKWITTSKIPFIDEKGDMIGIIGISMDITERKQAEEALRESEEKYRSLIEQASDGIFICDHKGVLSEVNPAGRVLLGFADEDPSGSNIRDFLHTDNQDDDRLHLDDLAIGHGILQEYGVTRKDGSKIHVEINAIRMFNNQIQGIIRDISSRKQAEKESDRLMQELIENQARLKALSSELVRSQEQERRQIARELHDDVGQQLMAAELKLKMYKSKYVQKGASEQINEILKYIDDSLAKVHNISLNLHPSILDELGLAAALRWLIDRQIQISDYKIHLDLGDFPANLSDETAITIFRVTQEALNNISRHAKATEVLIKVKPEKASVIMEISDNGQGFNVDEAINIAVSGGSLGLLSMRERAGFIGGEIDIESAEGGGTIIRGSFPMNT